MAERIKSISKYNGSAWGTAVPIGADASNVDMTTAPTDYDSSTSETSSTLIGTNDVKIISSDTDWSAWSKFNRFRKRVNNKFNAIFKTSLQTTGSNYEGYSTSFLNNYFSNVIGYTSLPSGTATVKSQLDTLNGEVGDWYSAQPTSHTESFTYDGSSSSQTFTDSSGYTWTYTSSSKTLVRNDTDCTITAISDSDSGTWTINSSGSQGTRGAAISSATTFTVTYTTAANAYDISKNLTSLNNNILNLDNQMSWPSQNGITIHIGHYGKKGLWMGRFEYGGSISGNTPVAITSYFPVNSNHVIYLWTYGKMNDVIYDGYIKTQLTGTTLYYTQGIASSSYISYYTYYIYYKDIFY